MPVHVESKRLPTAQRAAPRIALETARAGDGLSVLATLVYGDPPCARVDAGRLVALEGGVPLRDLEAEERLTRDLRSRLGLVPGHRVILEPAAAIAFAERLPGSGFEPNGDAHHAFRSAHGLEPDLSLAGDSFTLRFRVPGEGADSEADPARVLRAFQRGEPLVPLLGGGYAPLPADWLARYGAVLGDLMAARDPKGKLPTAALPDLARLAAMLDQPPPPGFERLASLLEGDRPRVAQPEDLRAELRPYQEEGFRWLTGLGRLGLGGLLADDMGLGKTLQALCTFEGRTLGWSSTPTTTSPATATGPEGSLALPLHRQGARRPNAS
jgi:hypothetical protein